MHKQTILHNFFFIVIILPKMYFILYMVEYLKDVVIYNEDNSYKEYSGQGVIFTLNMTDGTQTSIMAYNPFLVIDGIGYKTKYEPCEALNS